MANAGRGHQGALRCKKSRNAALADLVGFSLFTGVRRGEALGLTWDRVDRARGVIRLELTKSGRRREVPLSSNADAVLARRWTPEAKGYVFESRNWIWSSDVFSTLPVEGLAMMP